MELALLYSGGKDSSLAALVVEPFYDVTLVTTTFGLTDDWQHAQTAADALGFSFDTVELDNEVAERAVDQMASDGFPRAGIQLVHDHALETVGALDYDAVADGTRRDDRVPTVSRASAQSIEDRFDVDYIAPLSGFGRHAVDRLVASSLAVEAGPSESVSKADYEGELRALLAERHGEDAVSRVFPAHEQSYVHGRR